MQPQLCCMKIQIIEANELTATAAVLYRMQRDYPHLSDFQLNNLYRRRIRRSELLKKYSALLARTSSADETVIFI
jgi:hypothetical protein